MKTTYTNKTLYKYAYAMFPEPLTQETESLTQVAVSQTQIAESQTQMVVSQTQIAESQTQVFESPRLCNHASMHNAPKQFMITPKSTNIPQHQFIKHHLQYSNLPTAAHSHTIHFTLHIQYSILQNIINKFNILESTQINQNRYIQHTVGSDL